MVRMIVRLALACVVVSMVEMSGAASAYAGCPIPEVTGAKGAWQPSSKQTAYTALAEFGDDDQTTIVGLWELLFVSKGNPGIPDDAVLDFGYATWHSDGTEIMNSSRPPKTGSFCMGVWKKTGRSRYKLNHVALSWDPAGATFIGPARIHEEVIVGHGGDTYTGTFMIDQFDTTGGLLVHLTGSVAAHRISADD